MGAADNTAEIREEVLSLKPSSLAEMGGISEELIIQQLGPQPEIRENEETDSEDWLKDRSKLREQYLKKKVKYQEERDKLIGKILSDYVGFELAQAIKSKQKEFLDNTSRANSVAQFLSWLYSIIKKKIGVEGKKEEDDIRSLLTGGLTVKGCRGIRNYMARIEILLEQYTKILADKQVKKNPYNANEDVLMEIALNYVRDMIDADGQIIIAIYNEIVNYGLDKLRQEHFKRMEIQNNIRKGETPFKTVRSMLDDMNLKIDAMTSHGYDYRDLTINNVNQQSNCKYCQDKGRPGKHESENCWFNPESKHYRPNYTLKRKENSDISTDKKIAKSSSKYKEVKINNLQAKEEEEEEKEDYDCEEEIEMPV